MAPGEFDFASAFCVARLLQTACLSNLRIPAPFKELSSLATFTDLPIRVMSTCPPSSGVSAETYHEMVSRVADLSDSFGCGSILVYTDNGLLDPWLVAQLVIQSSERLSPLVAVQPVYMHPYSVAKMVSSLTHLHGRRVDLNLVAGGFKRDLESLGDETPHDRRYDRLVEFATIVLELLSGAPVTAQGEFYQVRGLRLTPSVPEELRPSILVSGSSPAGRAAATALGATPVQYPKPAREFGEEGAKLGGAGIRVGVVARPSSAEAWRVARERFPPDRKGQLTHQLAMKVSDSQWHEQLSGVADAAPEASPYWMVPFENYKTFCPYLVGSYAEVADELTRYFSAGCDTVILDVPPGPEDLEHTATAFDAAVRTVARVTHAAS